MYQAWLTRAGAIFGEPLPHAPAPTLPGAGEPNTGDTPAPPSGVSTTTGGERDDNLVAVDPPEIPDIPGPPAGAPASEPSADDPSPSAGEDEAGGTPPDAPAVTDAVREMIAAAHAGGVTARTLNRLAVLLAARTPDTVLRLEDVDDKLAIELTRRLAQAHNLGWDDDTLAEMTEKALRSERHRTAAQRRKAFREHLDRLTAEPHDRAQQATPEAA